MSFQEIFLLFLENQNEIKRKEIAPVSRSLF